jgi:hypothetical protein
MRQRDFGNAQHKQIAAENSSIEFFEKKVFNHLQNYPELLQSFQVQYITYHVSRIQNDQHNTML